MGIVDYLKSKGQDSSFSARQKLAQQYGISNYSGTADQNNLLLNKVQNNSQNNSQTSNNVMGNPSAQTRTDTNQYVEMISPSGQQMPVLKSQEQVFVNSGFSYPGQNSQVQNNPTQQIQQSTSQPVSQANQQNISTNQQTQNDFQNFSDLPDNIKNSSSWQSLSNDQKSLAYFTYKTQIASTDAQKIDAQKALEEAKKLADPYFKEQIRLAQDEINRSVSSIKNDAQSKVAQLQTRIQQIQEDLKFNKDNLTIDQQTELASQIRKNEGDLFNLQQNMAESGLAFSSPRQKAEQNLAADQQGLAESTQRKYNNQKYLAEQDAARNTASINSSLADIERQKQEKLLEIARKGEQQLGSANFSGVDGVSNLGNVTGALPTQNQSQIIDLQNKLINRGNPFTF